MRTKLSRGSAKSAQESLKEPQKVPPEASTDEKKALLTENSDNGTDNRVAISWYTKPDGKIDFSRMREKTKEQLKALVSDPSVLKAIGVTPEHSPEQVKVISDDFCRNLYDLIEKVQCAIISAKTKIPIEIVRKHLAFTDAELDQLAPATAKVLNKYAFDWLIRFQEEIALGILLISIMSSKLASIKDLKRESLSPASSNVKPNGAEHPKENLA